MNENTKQAVEEDKLWTKHIDTRYICGEDLNDSVNGLSPEMDVYIASADEGETYDQNAQKKEVKWILMFNEIMTNEPLYKGIVANAGVKTVFKTMTGSNVIQDAYGLPVTVYSKEDRRHGFVVRFKPFNVRKHNVLVETISKLKECKTVDELGKVYKGLDALLQNNVVIKIEAGKLKSTLK